MSFILILVDDKLDRFYILLLCRRGDLNSEILKFFSFFANEISVGVGCIVGIGLCSFIDNDVVDIW